MNFFKSKPIVPQKELTSMRNNVKRIVRQDLIVFGAQSPSDGYGKLTQNIVLELLKTTDVAFCPIWQAEDANKSLIKQYIVPDNTISKNYFLFHTPTFTKSSLINLQENKILLTMFESNHVPTSWKPYLEKMNTLLFPCTHNYELIKNEFPQLNVKLYNPGIDLSFYNYRAKRPTDTKFTFLFLFGNCEFLDQRKNGLLVLESFIQAFGSNKDVQLIMKCTSKIPKYLKEQLTDNIIVIDERYTEEQIRNLYYTSHCFLFPSRGEGYGLPPREAIACGTPTIATNFSALKDISKYIIPLNDYKLIPAFYQKNEAVRHNNGNVLFGEWADPNKEEFIESMLAVYNNYNKYQKKLASNIKEFQSENNVVLNIETLKKEFIL